MNRDCYTDKGRALWRKVIEGSLTIDTLTESQQFEMLPKISQHNIESAKFKAELRFKSYLCFKEYLNN